MSTQLNTEVIQSLRELLHDRDSTDQELVAHALNFLVRCQHQRIKITVRGRVIEDVHLSHLSDMMVLSGQEVHEIYL